MPRTDLSMYYATLDSPAGPMYVDEPESTDGYETAACDENGEPTVGGRIGQRIAFLIMLVLFLGFWFGL